jgi:hypothetical protein
MSLVRKLLFRIPMGWEDAIKVYIIFNPVDTWGGLVGFHISIAQPSGGFVSQVHILLQSSSKSPLRSLTEGIWATTRFRYLHTRPVSGYLGCRLLITQPSTGSAIVAPRCVDSGHASVCTTHTLPASGPKYKAPVRATTRGVFLAHD